MDRIDRELFEAARENNVPEVCRLLKAGADIEAKDILYGSTPLHWANYKGHVQVVKELLDHGANTEAEGFDGDTPLHCACWYGHFAIVIGLLGHGVNIDAKESLGHTPLHLAILRGHLAIVKALLAVGADILAADNQGHLPINYAVRGGSSVVSKCLLRQYYTITRRLPLHELVENLTWIGNPNSSDVPPLRAALHQDVLGTGDVVEIIEYLVGQNPALLTSRDEDGSLPLHVACRRGASFTVVQSLVNFYQASVKSVTSEGHLPLFLACERPEPSLDTIFVLIKLYPDLVYSYR
jgi:ankyrin repeat protein